MKFYFYTVVVNVLRDGMVKLQHVLKRVGNVEKCSGMWWKVECMNVW